VAAGTGVLLCVRITAVCRVLQSSAMQRILCLLSRVRVPIRPSLTAWRWRELCTKAQSVSKPKRLELDSEPLPRATQRKVAQLRKTKTLQFAVLKEIRPHAHGFTVISLRLLKYPWHRRCEASS
jgi:hypothetical protein